MNIFVCTVCAVLMILGAAELVRLLVFWWTKPFTAGSFTVLVAPESGEDCECVVRAAAERLRWMDARATRRLVCVNRNNDPDIDKICRFLSLRYPYLKVSKTTDLVYHILDEK